LNSQGWQRPAVVFGGGYLLIVAVCCGYIHWHGRHAANKSVQHSIIDLMSDADLKWTNTDLKWTVEATKVEVPAKPSGLWTLVGDYLRGPALVRFETDSKSEWNYSPRVKCSPDGDFNALISPQGCLMPGAPVGALIGKIGGSSAGQSDGKLFLVGSFAVIEVDPNTHGPLYLTINDEISNMGNNEGSLKVTISMAPVTPGSINAPKTLPQTNSPPELPPSEALSPSKK